MTAPQPKRNPYDDSVEAELARNPDHGSVGIASPSATLPSPSLATVLRTV